MAGAGWQASGGAASGNASAQMMVDACYTAD